MSDAAPRVAKRAAIDFSKYFKALEPASPVQVRGRVVELVGLVVKAAVPGVRVGELCYIHTHHRSLPVKAEVVGFQGDAVLLMPLGELEGVGLDSDVIPAGRSLSVRVGEALLGRVLNGLGEPIDEETMGPLETYLEYPVHGHAPDPLKRKRIKESLPVGVRSIDSTLTVGEGQRVGIFAAAGGGKSTLMGMIARNTKAEINVIALIGERGREVRDFLEDALGEEGLARSVVVCATSDQPSLVRLKSAYVATAIAEYFRDQGRKVMLMMDSVTRFARAQREVGLAAGEPPARAGYTPSVFSELPKLLERSGNSDKGSITAFYTVLVAGDDMNEPVADEVRSILDGHIILSASLAAVGHYPAIDVLRSKSRVMTAIADKDHLHAAKILNIVLGKYEEQKDLINIGAYERGSDREVDYAIDKRDEVIKFLKQGEHEREGYDSLVDRMKELFRDCDL